MHHRKQLEHDCLNSLLWKLYIKLKHKLSVLKNSQQYPVLLYGLKIQFRKQKGMAENILKLKIVFKVDNTDPADVWNDFKSFFEKKYSISCYDAAPQQVVQDDIHQEPLFKVNIYINTNGMNIGKLLAKVCNHWCSWKNKRSKEKASYSWLIPESKNLLSLKKPFHQGIQVKEFAFGTIPNMNFFVQHYNYKSHTDINCTFYHNKQIFSVFINYRSDCNHEHLQQKFDIKYNSIARVLVNEKSNENEQTVEVFFQLFYPPFVYAERKRVQNKLNHYTQKSEMANQDRSCQPNIASGQNFQELKWERILEFGYQCNRSRCHVKTIGKALVLKIVLRSVYEAHNVIERLMQRCAVNVEFGYTPINTVLLKKKILREINSFSFLDSDVVFPVEKNNQLFSCEYAWKSVLSSSLEINDQLELMYDSDKFVSTDHWSFLENDLRSYAESNPQALTDTLFHISEMMCRNVIFTFILALKNIFHYYCELDQKDDLPTGMCLVRRIIIMPSRTVFLPSTESFDNRVIRDFTYGTEYMLRVSIQDDNFSKLTFAVQYHSQKMTFMEEVVGKNLRQGIRIGNRLYEFLAASNSQLREHGLWLYSKDANQKTAADIRRLMGDFSNITNVAKYMARMGQCFSTSDEAIQITILNKNAKRISDEKTADEKYTFSDGIGMISEDLIIEILKAKEKPGDSCDNKLSYRPSAYQIRYKGCKGMVCENPHLRGRMLCYRPSMEKFICKSSSKLEIVKISAPRPLYLNRPFITILEQLGIQAEVFGKLQMQMIFDFTDSLIYEEKASHMLSNHLSLPIPFFKLQQAGINLTTEPFFRSLLIAVYKNAIGKLHTKARIAVPHHLGRNMLGVLDETRTLNYGEVFVQYSEELGCNISQTHILTGTVVISKNPCMHPGDVRKLKAIDVPDLHHIKDCIVFPSKGNRPHPDEMAGSDLDGDEYMVIWSEELIFANENEKPMLYPTIQGEKSVNKIEVDTMISFLCKYIQNDNIGTFANAHLAWADRLPDGIFSKKCIDIASKYPHVLDFAKTGETKYLTKEEKSDCYPDFMEKRGTHNSYHSKRALGSLYRFVRSLEACINKADLTICDVEYDSVLKYPGWEIYKESAENMFLSYKKRVTMILNKYGIKCETEALSGHFESVFKHTQNHKEMDNIVLIVKRYLLHIMSKYHYMFLHEVENERKEHHLSKEQVTERKYQRASAWYMTTYYTHSNSGILSFPWILSDILIDICQNFKRKGMSVNTPVRRSFHSLDELLIELFVSTNKSNETCACVTITKSVVHEWMVTSQLNLSMFTSKKFCFQCFQTIFNYFRMHSDNKCCSWNEDCFCEVFCSPSELIMKFLKFYIPSIVDLGKCEGDCKGFENINLQLVALETYVNLAVTRNWKYLGLSLGEMDSESDCSVQEADPIRISLVEDLKHLFYSHMDEIRKVLINITGVTDIQTSMESENNGNDCVLISSTGTSHQRWSLERLIMNPKLADLLIAKIKQS